MKNQTQIRAAFWASHPQYTRLPGRRQNDYKANVRTAFVDYIDGLARNRVITATLAGRVTL